MSVPADLKIPDEYASRLVNPATYATGEIHDIYAWLRENNPLGVAEVEGFDPFWVVTKYQDILDISRDNKLFPYGDRPSILTDQLSDRRAREITGTPNLVYTLVQMDEPDHMKYRLLTQAWFAPGNLKKRAAEIRAIAQKTVAHMASLRGEADFVEQVALNYPLEVVMNILGVPREDFPLMLRLTQEIFGPLDPEMSRMLENLPADQFADMMHMVVSDFSTYFEKISDDRRRHPRDDLATLIANAEIDGKPIEAKGASGYYIIVATAGHDTTSSSTAVAMWALATVPGLLDRLQADPALLPAFIDEAIRWATPVKTFMRSPAADVRIRDRDLKKGDWVMLCYASGNRDEDVFDDPFTFNIDRGPNRHVAFGFGPHLCLGQHLARMEMRILFEELLPRLASVQLAGEPRLTEAWFVNGPKSLPIKFEMTDA